MLKLAFSLSSSCVYIHENNQSITDLGNRQRESDFKQYFQPTTAFIIYIIIKKRHVSCGLTSGYNVWVSFFLSFFMYYYLFLFWKLNSLIDGKLFHLYSRICSWECVLLISHSIHSIIIISSFLFFCLPILFRCSNHYYL